MPSTRTYSFWETSGNLTPTANRSPSPEKSCDVLIVGAGFCGSWLAYFLKKKSPGLKIQIVERDFIGFGASLRNAGFLSCGNVSEWWEDLQDFSWEETVATFVASIKGIQTIRQEFGDSVPSQRCGSIDFDPLTDEKETLLHRFNEVLKPYATQPFFEIKEVQLAGKKQRSAFSAFDGEANPTTLLLALHKKLQQSGVRIAWSHEVKQLGKGEAVIESWGEQNAVRYTHAFLCTNAFARKLNPQSHVVPARGQILVTSPCQTQTTRALGYFRAGYDYLRFIGDRVLVGGGRRHFKERENTDVVETTQEIRNYLAEFARQVIGHSDFTIDAHWSGIMGMRHGKHASISDLLQTHSMDSQTDEIAGFGGWGVVLTPYVARHRAESF